ncbi:MoaD/ThiS family protein [Asticcacaulis sp.]|uniref:MoaD/ThiS family protein n=1 Tax=Asticcacaulis sp. TaxID=1872648 RepID=UPI002B747270|nr:MoaD/ThiS family protein [Asticcacaulis sp.]HTM79882.1 MoaD/ThiS family protein [Asticcacaulis sp.]
MIDILFFGRVADMQGKRRLAMTFPEEGLSLFALRLRLFNGEADERMRMSVNQVMVTADQPLHDGDEVAFFSVFSGG